MLLVLNSKAVCSYITSILLLSVGVNLIFRGIINYSKIKLAILLKGLVRI